VAVARGAQCVNVGVSKLGGIVAAFDAATVARAFHLQVTVGSVVELGIATAAGLQLATALPELAYPSYLMGSRKYERQITWPPLEVADSRAVVPSPRRCSSPPPRRCRSPLISPSSRLPCSAARR
jgi:L-alanine-DL-glutamate epimerase-like enolase superfamily enzyme